MKHFKIAVAAGHSIDEPGVETKLEVEGESRILSEHRQACLVVHHLKRMFPRNYDLRWVTGDHEQKVSGINLIEPDLALEIHFNGFRNPIVGGAETLHDTGGESLTLAGKVQDRLVRHLGLRNRGIKPGWFQGDKSKGLVYFLWATDCPAIITEGLFLTNPEEAKLLLKPTTRYAYALGIAEGIIDYLEA